MAYPRTKTVVNGTEFNISSKYRIIKPVGAVAGLRERVQLLLWLSLLCLPGGRGAGAAGWRGTSAVGNIFATAA